MAINIHPADALIHRLLQLQSSSSSRKAASQQQAENNVSEKVTISVQACTKPFAIIQPSRQLTICLINAGC